jgi:hypothetical protein
MAIRTRMIPYIIVTGRAPQILVDIDIVVMPPGSRIGVPKQDNTWQPKRIRRMCKTRVDADKRTGIFYQYQTFPGLMLAPPIQRSFDKRFIRMANLDKGNPGHFLYQLFPFLLGPVVIGGGSGMNMQQDRVLDRGHHFDSPFFLLLAKEQLDPFVSEKEVEIFKNIRNDLLYIFLVDPGQRYMLKSQIIIFEPFAFDQVQEKMERITPEMRRMQPPDGIDMGVMLQQGIVRLATTVYDQLLTGIGFPDSLDSRRADKQVAHASPGDEDNFIVHK